MSKKKENTKRLRNNRFVHEHKPTVAVAIRSKMEASGLRPVEFWEQAALTATLRSVIHVPTFLEVAEELGRIGGNVFQILKETRFSKKDPRRELLEHILSELKAIKTKINKNLG